VTDHLAAAAEAARRDLEASRRWDEAAEAALQTALTRREWWLAQWPEGAEHLEGLIAQDIQEWMHDHVDHDWPLCPEHRDHALFVEPDLGPDPFWVCHRTGLPVAAVGSLPADGEAGDALEMRNA
jgi:hypothetical protein